MYPLKSSAAAAASRQTILLSLKASGASDTVTPPPPPLSLTSLLESRIEEGKSHMVEGEVGKSRLRRLRFNVSSPPHRMPHPRELDHRNTGDRSKRGAVGCSERTALTRRSCGFSRPSFHLLQGLPTEGSSSSWKWTSAFTRGSPRAETACNTCMTWISTRMEYPYTLGLPADSHEAHYCFSARSWRWKIPTSSTTRPSAQERKHAVDVKAITNVESPVQLLAPRQPQARIFDVSSKPLEPSVAAPKMIPSLRPACWHNGV